MQTINAITSNFYLIYQLPKININTLEKPAYKNVGVYYYSPIF